MKYVVSFLGPIVLGACSTSLGISYPSDFHQYEELRSFKAPPIEQIEGQSIRLTWHAWHKAPGLILANCANQQCHLEVRFTDGYGTYRQGSLKGIRKADISREEFDAIDLAFERGGFTALEPQLRENDEYLGAAQSDGSIAICIHAPHYYLETLKENRRHIIYRYCQDNYDDGLRIAMPLVELAEHYFPNEMSKIIAVWIEEERPADPLKH